MAPSDRRYQPTHEWAKQEDGQVTVGITDIAVQLLSDLVYVDLPETGRKVEQGDVFGEIESVKAVSELIAPVRGEITAVNVDLPDQLDTLARDPYGAGWLVKIQVDGDGGLAALMDAATYERHAAAEEH